MNNFEQFIKQCCKAKEWNLRNFLITLLERNGFTIKQDNYCSAARRGPSYRNVHNLLATRGNARTCLVAHTDVCRDHAYGAPDVYPETKLAEIDGDIKTIIQDKGCNYQVGGDDRLGVAINTYIALNSGYDVALLFTTDEEVGAVSAENIRFPELLNYELLIQVDRGNHSNQLVTSIGGHQICSDDMAERLLQIATDIKLPRYAVNGMLTDVLEIHRNGMCKNAVNMTCGYHNSYGAEATEYIDLQEAKDTMKYVGSIVKYFYLENDKTDNFSSSKPDNEYLEHYTRTSRYEDYNEGLFSEDSYNKDKCYDDEYDPTFANFKY
jgi:hypothetical protein